MAARQAPEPAQDKVAKHQAVPDAIDAAVAAGEELLSQSLHSDHAIEERHGQLRESQREERCAPVRLCGGLWGWVMCRRKPVL